MTETREKITGVYLLTTFEDREARIQYQKTLTKEEKMKWYRDYRAKYNSHIPTVKATKPGGCGDIK